MRSFAKKTLKKLVELIDLLHLALAILIRLSMLLLWDLTKSGSYWQKTTDWLALRYKKACTVLGDAFGLLLWVSCVVAAALLASYNQKPPR